jgi:hypothetical protein
VRNVVPRQAIEILWLEPIPVSQFDAVGPTFWKPCQKAVQRGNKIVKKNGAPDRVFLEGLRQDSGGKWVWDKVWWEYADGRRVQYPDWADIAKK